MKNKPLLVILLVILAGAGAYALLRPTPDTGPDLKGRQTVEDPFLKDPGGVPTDEPGDFHVDVEARKEGARNVLEFTVTESHGWGALAVYIRFWHQVKKADTDEWEQDPVFDPVTILSEHPLKLGEPLVAKTTLTGPELRPLNGELGTSEEWAAEVSQTKEIRKPK